MWGAITAQAIRDLFKKINQTNETVSRIDKESATSAKSLEILIDDVKDQKKEFKKHVSDPQDCSSQRDVGFLLKEKVLQNGRIDRLTSEVGALTTAINTSKDRKEWKKEWKADLVKLVVTIVILGGFLITYDKWRTGKQHAAFSKITKP